MWVTRSLFEMIVGDNKRQADQLTSWQNTAHALQAEINTLRAQKAKDDLSIDWMRHRVNALERERATLLLSKGIQVPVPEIVPTRPGSMSAPSMDYMPSFEDVGDAEAHRLGISHDPEGHLAFADTEPAQAHT